MRVYTDICMEMFFSFFIFVRNNCQSGRILWMVPLVKIFIYFLFVHRNSHKVNAFCEGPLIYLFVFFFVVRTLTFCP